MVLLNQDIQRGYRQWGFPCLDLFFMSQNMFAERLHQGD